jgi:hypothetical protein
MNYKHKVVLLLVALSVSLGAFSQNLNLRFQNVTVRKAMTELKQRTGYSFVYEGTDLNTKKKVTVNAQSVNEAVKQILQGQDATYEIQGKSIIVRHQMPGSTQPRREDVQQQKSTIKASGERLHLIYEVQLLSMVEILLFLLMELFPLLERLIIFLLKILKTYLF